MSKKAIVGAVMGVVLFVLPARAQTTWHVDETNCPGPGSGTQIDPFCRIQVAILAASEYDEVVVATGTYVENINFLGKPISLRSVDPDDPGVVASTVIDGSQAGSVVTFVSHEGSNSVLEGITISNGSGTLGANNTIWGGGIYCIDSSPSIRNCVISDNGAGCGGGIHLRGSGATFRNCRISRNSAEAGAGVYISASDPDLSGCMIVHNFASHSGGAVFSVNTPSQVSQPVLTNCTLSYNSAVQRGGALYIGNGTLANSVLWGNRAAIGPQIRLGGRESFLVIGYTDIEGGRSAVVVHDGTLSWENGNLETDPLFVDPDGGDFRLQPDSPCIDSGDNAAVPEDLVTDLDGNVRFSDDPSTPDTGHPDGVHPIVDMGAYEFQPSITAAGQVDIKPTSCPNPVNVRARGVVPVAIVGTESFDVTQVVFDSLILGRTDGVGVLVTPILRRGRPKMTVRDVATPFVGSLCDCHKMSGDGIDDLLIRFSTPEIVSALQLDALPHRTSVALTLTGSLTDGTVFEASDCVVVTGQPGRTSSGSRIGGGHHKP